MSTSILQLSGVISFSVLLRVGDWTVNEKKSQELGEERQKKKLKGSKKSSNVIYVTEKENKIW